MSLIQEVFGRSPFSPLVEHSKKVHECVLLIRPLMEAAVAEDHEGIHRLQDEVSKLEYEADKIKHTIREQLPRRFFLPVERADLDRYLHCEDNMADHAQDLAVILLIRHTRIHPALVEDFYELVDQVAAISSTMMGAAEEMMNLAETSFSGVEAQTVLEKIGSLGEEEWKADRIQRKLSRHIYDMEKELDPITIMFYEKIMRSLSAIANAADNTGEVLRAMILKR